MGEAVEPRVGAAVRTRLTITAPFPVADSEKHTGGKAQIGLPTPFRQLPANAPKSPMLTMPS
jgi:hypothetical protein